MVRKDAMGTPAVVMGRYIFTPAAAYSAPGARGTLHGDGKPVELYVTEPLLGEFVEYLSRAQKDLDQRWGAQEPSDGNVARV
ncbi:hypothetical protein OG288_28510 [Streptomyces tauricus]|uniref:DUF397 domain-containing protein n=1 Tax=Streptomyces tauricus TaxID=68274 RepID=A0ABZ1JLI7_9ACTN|nr:hypothetical protein [Streptomyces tauricus]